MDSVLILKVDSLILEAKREFNNDSIKSRELGERALNLAKKIGYDEGLTAAYRRLASYYLVLGRFELSRKYYNLNLQFYLGTTNFQRQAMAYLSLSEVTSKIGLRVETLDNLLKALDICEEISDKRTLTRVLNRLGNEHRQANEYDKSLAYYNRALKIRSEQNDSLGLVNSYQVLGNLYGESGEIVQAKEHYESALILIPERFRARLEPGLLTNIGNVYYKLSSLDSAEYFYQMALKLREESGNVYSQTLLLNNLTALAFEQKEYHKSIDYAEEGLTLAKEVGSPQLLSSLYYNLSDSYKSLGDYKRSFEYYKLSDSIDYEITNTEKNAQLAELQVKFDTEKKDKEIAQQSLDLTEANTQRNQLFAGIGLLVLVAGFVSWSWMRKRRANFKLQAQKTLIEKREQEKALLLRELHHRVKNNFQVVSSLLNLQYYEAESTGAAEAIKAGQTRVEAMSMIHRELYQGDNDTALEMKDYVVHLIENAIYLYDFDPDLVRLELDIDNHPLDVKYAIPLGIIINELITNAFKHAFQSVAKPVLSVALNISSTDKQLCLKVRDNGPGLPLVDPASTSFGLELIRDLIKQLKGELETSGLSGAEFVITIPYKPISVHVEG